MDTVNNGLDAVEKVQKKEYDIVFLDENMPGLSGLETLDRIKLIHPRVPIVMITKSEEEHIMEGAIGGKISDYLIKPVNPNQILLSLKKNLEGRRLVSEKTTSDYQQQFRQLGMRLGDNTLRRRVEGALRRTGALGTGTEQGPGPRHDRYPAQPMGRGQRALQPFRDRQLCGLGERPGRCAHAIAPDLQGQGGTA